MSAGARIAQLGRRMNAMRMVLALVAVLGLAACGDDGLGPDPESVKFAASLGIDLSKMQKLADGTYIQTVVAGTGTTPLKITDNATVNQQGWLANGSQFSPQSVIAKYPVLNYVPGFTNGIIGMKTGETRKIVIPGSQGYGSSPPSGSGIPNNAVLVFQVTLISIP